MPDFTHERRHAGIIAGIDEAGRGPLAGPVVAAAVILDRRRTPQRLRDLLDDSKQLSRYARESAFAPIGGSPLTLKSYSGPVSNDAVTIDVQQSIGSGDALRTGTYSKTFTFTLSTTTP